MANFGFFQISDFASFNALAAPLQALGHTVTDETAIQDLSQLPIGAVDCAIFLAGSGELTTRSQTLASQLWDMRQLPIVTQSASSHGIRVIQSANCYGSPWGSEQAVVQPIVTDPLTVSWAAGVQEFAGGYNPGILTSRCDILTLTPGTEILANLTGVVVNGGTPASLNGMPVYLRLRPSPSQFWIHWHNAILGDASWSQDLATYLGANVIPTSTIPTCSAANCPQPNVCLNGMCFAPCVAGGCQPPYVCQNGVCVGPCSPQTCPSPNACVNGICSPPCGPGGTCPPPATCQNGHCVSPCSPANCPVPDACINGICVSPCISGVCPPGYVCQNGYCLPPGTGMGSEWWVYGIAVGLPALWIGAARLHELGKI